jgi:protein TonB
VNAVTTAPTPTAESGTAPKKSAPPPARKTGWTLDRANSTLYAALAVSVLAHAVLLTIRFIDPEAFNRVFEDTPLEVVLVNAHSQERPDKPQAIAQTSLVGGGEADQGRATSPVPVATIARSGESLEEEEQRLEAMKTQQSQLLATLKKELANLPPPEPKAQQKDAAAQERELQRQRLIKLVAEIEKRINEENARPRKRFIGPSTREEVYALYYDTLRRKIEDYGTRNFPQAAGKKLYGELTMAITINHDGQVLITEVIQTSGKIVLDRRAEALVRGLGFDDFNKEMRRKADQIVVISRFKFTRDDTLNTTLTSQ